MKDNYLTYRKETPSQQGIYVFFFVTMLSASAPGAVDKYSLNE
jgi:hypothetical protein